MNGNTPESKLPERLRRAAESLNRESDALTASLKSVEQALKSLGLGIEVQIKEPVRVDKDFVGDHGEYLLEWKLYVGYGKIDGAWKLYIFADADGPDPVTRGLSELPREDRVLLAKHLPALLDLMADEADKLVKQVQEAKVSALDAAKKLLK